MHLRIVRGALALDEIGIVWSLTLRIGPACPPRITHNVITASATHISIRTNLIHLEDDEESFP